MFWDCDEQLYMRHSLRVSMHGRETLNEMWDYVFPDFCLSLFCLPSVLEMSSSLPCSTWCISLQVRQVSQHDTHVHTWAQTGTLRPEQTLTYTDTHTLAHSVVIVPVSPNVQFFLGPIVLSSPSPFSSTPVHIHWSVASPPGDLLASCTGQEHYQWHSACGGSPSHCSPRC